MGKYVFGIIVAIDISKVLFFSVILSFFLFRYRILFIMDKRNEKRRGNGEWIALKFLEKFKI